MKPLLCTIILAFTAISLPAQISGTTVTPITGGIGFLPPGSNNIEVTVSIQSGMAQALVKLNFNGYSVTACKLQGPATQLGGGLLWQGVEKNGLRLVTPNVAYLAANQKRAKSKTQLAATLGAELLFDFGVAAAGNVIQANPATLAGKAVRIAPLILGRKMSDFSGKLDALEPPLSNFTQEFLSPTALYAVPSDMGVCIQKTILASTGGPDGFKFNIVW